MQVEYPYKAVNCYSNLMFFSQYYVEFIMKKMVGLSELAKQNPVV